MIRTGTHALACGLAAAALMACEPTASDSPRESRPLQSLPVNGVKLDKLRIGSTAFIGGDQAKRGLPLVKYLEQKTGLPTTVVEAESYEQLVQRFTARELDLAMLSALTYVKHASTLKGVPIATGTHSGSPTYLGYFVTLADSSYRSLEQLKGKRVGWVSQSSTSGYLFPRQMMRHRGLDPDRFFAPSPLFAGNHKKVLDALVNGSIDVAATADSFVNPGTQRLVADDIKLRVVAKTRRIPFDCVVIRNDAALAQSQTIRQALLNLSRDVPTREALASSLGVNGFVPVTKGRYDGVRNELKQDLDEASP